ncbi:MAG: phosphoribosyltransferase domain-containing protein [Gammaproteobacteria bacterium]|nr:phosphoribosyltransferase domain-containing protein [Gammaproteobacteria bacterium]
MNYGVQLRAGTLRITTRREDLPLATLLDFASRQNPRRGYLFVSKVLGKHIPCRPSVMRDVYRRLAEPLIGLPSPIVVVGMAETATGLGAGLAHSLSCATHGSDVLYLHTTRHHLDSPIWLSFDENHSHAPDHLVYAPQGEKAQLFEQARSLILVDDEISTGRTLSLLTAGLTKHLPRLAQLRWSSIVNWLDLDKRQDLTRRIAWDLDFVSLLEGEFEFQADPAFRPQLPARLAAIQPSRYARDDTGRLGLIMPYEADSPPADFMPESPLVIVGTGEFSFFPFRLAEDLEQQGHDVLFQSTTRSPILEGEAIRRKLMFTDEHHEGIINYLYNLPQDRQVLVAYEHPAMARQHELPTLVDARVWALPWRTPPQPAFHT